MSSRSTTRSTAEDRGARHDQVVELVRTRERAALAALTAAAGDSSLCALSRAGKPYPAVKFHEGAVAALADVRRTLVREPGTRCAAAVGAARGRWEERTAGLAQRGRDWAAYHAGGAEALGLLATAIGEPG